MFFLSCREVEGRGKGRERAIELEAMLMWYHIYSMRCINWNIEKRSDAMRCDGTDSDYTQGIILSSLRILFSCIPQCS